MRAATTEDGIIVGEQPRLEKETKKMSNQQFTSIDGNEDYKVYRNAVLAEAFKLQATILRLGTPNLVGPIPDALKAYVLDLVNEKEMSATAAVTIALWEIAIKPCPDFKHTYLAHGAVTTVEHSWFALTLNEAQANDPRWKFIVDPACPDVSPGCLVISPYSPLQLAYTEHRREMRK
jgi:hypothetical protein